MALTSGLAGQLECHIGKTVHVVLADLNELEVTTDDLVVSRLTLAVLSDLAICTDGEIPHLFVRPEVALAGLALHHGVGSIWQSPHVRLRYAVLDLYGQTHLIRLIKSSVDVDCPLTLVGDLKQRAIQTRASQRGQQQGFQVALLYENAAAHHLIVHVVGVDF